MNEQIVLNKKNIEGMYQNQKIQQEKIVKLEAIIGGLNTTIMELQQSIQESNQKMNIFLAQNRGRGGTV